MMTALVARLICFFIIVYLEVPLSGVVSVVREIILAVAHTLLIVLVLGIILFELVLVNTALRCLLLENLALRQQLAVLKRKHPSPRLEILDRFFWTVATRVWSGWQQALIVIKPETVVRWHRAGLRLYWRLISRVRKPIGRRQTPKEVRQLIFRMVAENPTWGAPRIHGELLMLGFDVSERTISRWMK